MRETPEKSKSRVEVPNRDHTTSERERERETLHREKDLD
jgi:hypothetical protein